MTAAACESPAQPAVQSLDGGIEHAPGGIDMLGRESVRIAWKTGSWQDQVAGDQVQPARNLVRLKRLERTVGLMALAVISMPFLSGPWIGPRRANLQQFGELRPGCRVGISKPWVAFGHGQWQHPPCIRQWQWAFTVANQTSDFRTAQFQCRLMHQSLCAGQIKQNRGPGQAAGLGLGDRSPYVALSVKLERILIKTVKRTDRGFNNRGRIVEIFRFKCGNRSRRKSGGLLTHSTGLSFGNRFFVEHRRRTPIEM